MKEQALQNRERLYEIRRKMLSGEISYEQAKEQASPVIKAINEKAAEIAKKYGKRSVPRVSFAAIMR